MKIKKRYQVPLVALMFQTTTIARFGPARLVRKPDGRHELIGGTADHHAAAREWCSLFAPEVVFNTGGTPLEAARSRWPDCQRSSQRTALAA
jgi:hypothetical protein